MMKRKQNRCGVCDALLPRTSEWQPIETAPRDGTRIICRGPRLRVAECEYRASRPIVDGQPGWYRSNQPPEVHPSHWMPLPDRPHTESADAMRDGMAVA